MTGHPELIHLDVQRINRKLTYHQSFPCDNPPSRGILNAIENYILSVAARCRFSFLGLPCLPRLVLHNQKHTL